MTIPDHYATLGIAPHASPTDIEAAYQQQRRLHDPTHGAAMGDAFAEDAAVRRQAIEAAFATLGDPQQRFRYDEARGLVGSEATDRRGVANREVMWTIMGVLAGLLILSLVYNLSRGNATARGFENRFTVVNYEAPPINLRNLDGGNFDLTAYRGKVVVVNFWGTWCEPCRAETPALQAVYERWNAQGLAVVGVNLFDDERTRGNGEAQVRSFAELYRVTYPIALDEANAAITAYKAYLLPTSYIVDPNGNVRYIRVGELTQADVEWAFAQLRGS